MGTLVGLFITLRTLLRRAGTRDADSAAVVTSPMARRPRRVPSRQQMRRTAAQVYIVALLLANALLVYMGGELVDLYISVVELWAELARKHLELTL